MSPKRLLAARLAALLAVGGGAAYMVWRAGQLDELGPAAAVFYAAELLNYLALFAAVLLFWKPHDRPPVPPPASAPGTLDILVPVCGEDVGMVEATLQAALAVELEHETIVLNDGRLAGKENWREIAALCKRLDVRCITRRSGMRGKAGNLNAALPLTSGEFIVVVDADHLARPELGEMLLGHFADPKMAFVTSHQSFRIERGDHLGHQEGLFYRWMQPAKDRDNAAFSCGNGVAYRRSAIESVGGFSEWNLVEDLHTSYRLHADGWRSAYVRIPVSIGSAPGTAAELASQRLRWATDSLRIFFWDNPLRKRGLTWRQRLHYLHTTGWYLVASAHVVFLLGPILTILGGVRLLAPGAELTYAVLLGLYLAPVALLLVVHVGWRAALRTAQLQAFLSPVFVLAVARALLATPRRRSRRLRSGVTRKTRQRHTSFITLFQHAVLVLLLVSLGYAIALPEMASWPVVLWACVLAAALATPGSMLGLQREASQSLRIAIAAPAVAGAVLVALSVWSTNSVNALGVGERSPKQLLSLEASLRPPLPLPVTDNMAPKWVPVSSAGRTLGPPRRGIYLGAHSSGLAGPPSQKLGLSRYSGAKLRIVHRFQAWWGPDRFLPPKWIADVATGGGVPMITWEPWRKPRDSVHAPNQHPGIVRHIAKGRYDLYIRRWARDAAAYRKPILLRFMHEMNGNWYPWSVNQNDNSPAEFRAAWRHVHRIFRREGATNVGWVFSVDAFAGGRPTPRGELNAYYPGRRYVDWVGMSGFNWSTGPYGGALTFERTFRRSYEVVRGLGKPVMLSELGSAAADAAWAANWVRDALRSTPTRFPRVKAIVFYDAAHPARDFKLRGRALAELSKAARLRALRPPVTLLRRR